MSEPMGDNLIQTITEEDSGESKTLQEKGVSSDLNLALPTAIILFALLTVTFPSALTKSCNMNQEVDSHRAKDRCRCLVVNRVLHWSFHLMRYNTYKPTSVVTTNPSLTYRLTASQPSTTKPSHSLCYLYWLNCNCELNLLKHKRWGSKPKWKEMLSHNENLFMMHPWKLTNKMAHWNWTKCLNSVPLPSSKSL